MTTKLGTDIKLAEQWLEKEGTEVVTIFKVKVVPLAIIIVEEIKGAEANGIIPAIATALSTVTKGLSIEANVAINAAIPGILAGLLGIQGIPANPTPAEYIAIENEFAVAIAGKTVSDRTELWTMLAVQLYKLISTAIGAQPTGTPLTFAQIVALVEAGFQQYQQDVLTLNTSNIDEAIPAEPDTTPAEASKEAS